MAAILQLRQGSTSTYISQGPNIAEPFFDTGSNILVVGKSATEVIKLTKLDESNLGSFDITGDYSGSNLYLTGDLTASNATLSGDITIGGNIILGDEIQDNITISGQFNSDLIPSQSLQYNLGSQTKKWNHLYASSASIDNIDLVSNLPSGTVSGSTQITDGSGIVSSSTQITDGSGIVSSSNQIDTGSTHFQEGVALYSINGVTPLSGLYGSANGLGVQIRGLSADGLSFDGPGNLIIDTGSDYFVSGAQQASLLGLPQGTVSSSQQVVDFLPTNTVSGSVQVLGGTNIVSSSVQVISFLPSGTVSGSQQIIDSLPTGTVSGSSQISELTHIHSFTSSYTDAISLNGDDVTILGNLTVQGTQTQLNTATLNIEDKNLLIASGAADSSAANGAGITIDGANKSLEWEHGTSQFVFNAQVSSSVGFKGDGSNLTDVTAEEIEYTNILNKPTLVSGSDQILGGTNIVSSSTQVINFLPTDTVSGSSQITDGSNIVSSSDQVLGATNIVSSSTQVINFLPTDTVSGSEQLTSDLDLRYPTIGGSNLLSSSNENFTAYSQSVDLRLENTLDSGSETSQSLYVLVGNFPTSGSLGTAAFYNVSSSLADDPNVIPNVKAVYDYINNTIGAADITGVSASLGLSGGGASGYVSLSLDTTSQHFINGVQSAQSYYGGWQAAATNGSPEYIYGTETLYFRGNGVTGDISTSITQLLGVTYIEFQINTGSAHFLNGVAATGAPQGTVSSSQQVIDLLPSGTISGSSQIDVTQTTNIQTLATTGSNIFIGNQTITGSLLITGSDLTWKTSFTENFPTEVAKDIIVFEDFDGSDGITYTNNHLRLQNVPVVGAPGDHTFQLNFGSGYGTQMAVGPRIAEFLVHPSGSDNSGSLSILDNGDKTTTIDLYATNVHLGKFDSTITINASNIITDSPITSSNTIEASFFFGAINATNGVVSGSSQLTENISTSEIIVKNSDGSFTGSNHYADSINLSVGSSTPTSVTSTEQLTVNGTTSTLSGVVAFTESDVLKSFDYVSSNVRYVDSVGGVSIALKPDADGTKAWIVDTDGDLVSNGGAWTSGNAYMNNLIASSSVTASNMIITNDVIISGDLNVAGTTTYTSTNNINIGDNIIELNFGGSATEGGILVKDATGTTTSGSLLWNSVSDSWTAGALGSESDIVTTSNFNSTRPSIAIFNTISGSNIHSEGTVIAEGDIVAYASSDRRLKDEIQPISNPLEKINQIGGYSFIWNTQKQDIYNGKDYGVIAQEIEEILPELVQTRENGYKAVKYDKLVSLLIEGIKELSQEVNELKEKLNRE